MARVSLPVSLKLAGKVVLAANLTILAVVNYRWAASRINFLGNSTSSIGSDQHYIPRCYSSIQCLANITDDTRWRLDIRCNNSEAEVFKHKVPQESGPYRLRWKDDVKCLKTFVRKNCFARKDHLVPNIIHYVWFGYLEFKAENFISVLSAIRFQQPCAILFHAQDLPVGPYWAVLLSIASNIIHVQRDAPSKIYGRRFGFIQHASDIVRLEVLDDLGGIYLDNDQILVRDVHELLNESFVMSHENKHNLANSMIMAQQGAAFIQLWYKQYKWYNPKKWGYHSTYVPWILARQNANLIRVVGNRFVNPDLTDILKVFNGHFDLSKNYGLHLYTRFFPKLQLQLPEVTTWNTSLGDLWRTVLYNSSDTFSCT